MFIGVEPRGWGLAAIVPAGASEGRPACLGTSAASSLSLHSGRLPLFTSHQDRAPGVVGAPLGTWCLGKRPISVAIQIFTITVRLSNFFHEKSMLPSAYELTLLRCSLLLCKNGNGNKLIYLKIIKCLSNYKNGPTFSDLWLGRK